jgi:peptidoglycan/xylan/chitin deacetylase (PgdA/CDA1 family)/GT2 family glycosyltransferase
MEQKYMISVVIPAFNEELLIAECLESLNHQDYSGEYEIIVVDNGSNDNTSLIAQKMGARIINCPQKGVSNARQAGADAAKGTIIVQADADTTYPKWWLSRIQKQFDTHPKAVAVAGTFIYRKPPWWAFFEYFARAFWNILATIFFRRPYIISGANFAFYKKTLAEIGGYHQQSYSSDQFDISTRLSKKGKIIFDRKSWSATSSRSVAKPTLVIIYEFGRNLTLFARNAIKALVSLLMRKRDAKSRSIKPGTLIKISIPILLIIMISIVCYGYFVPASPVFGRVYSKIRTTDRIIALTFDDGPNEPYTSQILDILAEYDIKATFFLVGKNVLLYPDTTRRILAEGNVIGNHTYSHNANHALFFSSYKDVQLAQETIFKVTGVYPHLYRPPHGKKSPWELGAIKNRNFIVVQWSISTKELSGNPAALLAEQIVSKSRPGGIILLHDGYGTIHNTEQADKHVTMEALPGIIRRLQSEGYTFVTVPELLNVPAYDKVSE